MESLVLQAGLTADEHRAGRLGLSYLGRKTVKEGEMVEVMIRKGI